MLLKGNHRNQPNITVGFGHNVNLKLNYLQIYSCSKSYSFLMLYFPKMLFNLFSKDNCSSHLRIILPSGLIKNVVGILLLHKY